ncbi:MAG: hypothetical protein HUJ61_02775, partial [Bacilli bacterium]|nr:hypothetical protein [Bacilli bacterium]
MKIKKMTNKFIQFLLAIVTAFILFPSTARADIRTEIQTETQTKIQKPWTYFADTSWYDETKQEFHIKTPAQFAALAVLVNQGNDFDGKKIILDADIDLSGHNWISIGNPEKWYFISQHRWFSGTFDGQNHCISNLTTDSSSYCHGLFGSVQFGTIKNVKIRDACIYNTGDTSRDCYIGILADYVRGARILGSSATGKIINTSTDAEDIGGLVGQCQCNTKIVGCYSSAKIQLDNISDDKYTAVGGLVGSWFDYATDAMISHCFFDGSIHCKGNPFVGGILGLSLDTSTKINSCFTATTDIICNKSDKVAWIKNAAWITNTETNNSVSDCYWPAITKEQACKPNI